MSIISPERDVIRFDLAQAIAPSFYEVHKAVVGRRTYKDDLLYNDFWLKGGRGSTKSSFVPIEIIRGMLADPLANAVVMRKTGATMKDSVFANFKWAISIMGLSGRYHAITSPMSITDKVTGQVILFKGLDDPEKVKSIKPVVGYFKYLWREELSEFASMEEVRNAEQSILRGGPAYLSFSTYNPPKDPRHWINVEANKEMERRLVHHSTYLDVPREWLGEDFFARAEALRLRDQGAYDHEYLGLSVGNTRSVVFSGRWSEGVIDLDEEEEDDWHGPYLGADFGFAEDPSTLIKVWVNLKAMLIYIEYEAVERGVELNHMGMFYDRVPGSRRTLIRGDSSRPETISYIEKQLRFRIEAAPKWKGSVEDGVEYIKSFKIIVHPRCVETINELRLYSYKIDRITGDILADIVDKFNHCIDAIRYALAPLIKRGAISTMDVL